MASAPCYLVDGGCICQIPTLETVPDQQGNNDVEYIAVLDASGSMYHVWEYVARAFNKFQESAQRFHTITFDSSARMKDRILSEDLNDNGGGGTNILAGIQLMKDLITRLRSQGSKSFLVIFVSDGHDGYNSGEHLVLSGRGFNTEGVEFTTVGVGYGFPTHVSMSLRNAFHQGRVNIPNVTLVEELENFEVDFSRMAGEILGCSGQKVTLDAPTKVAPWEELAEEMYEKTWVLLENIPEKLVMSSPDAHLEVNLVQSEWTYPSSEGVLKQWMNMLHARALAGQDVRPLAAPAAALATKIAESVEAVTLAAIESSKDGRKQPSVYQRLQKKLLRENHELSRLLKELKTLAEGDILSDLSDADLAQRLAIGTKEGKHHQRALRWKGVSQAEFQEYLTNFEKVMADCLPGLEAGPTDDNRSAVSLESNGDILLQEDLLQAIKAVPSQYHLVECVPVVGQPVLIKVTDASMINPWMVSVQSVSRICPSVDTCTLQEMANADGITQLPLGNGEVDPINAVCPLFPEDLTPSIGPFFRTKLYGMLMTHVVSKNIDTVDRDSHPALLASLLCHLLDEPQSTWRDTLVAKILETARGLYLSRGAYAGTLEALKNNPALAMVTEHPSINTKCQALSKPMLLSLCIADELTADQKVAILHRLYLEHIGRILGDNPGLMDWFIVTGIAVDQEAASQLSELNIDVKTYITQHAVRKAVQKAVADLEPKQADASQLKAEVLMDKLEASSKSWWGPASFKRLRTFAGWLCGQDNVPEIPLAPFVFHGCVHKNSFDRASNPVMEQEKVSKKVITAALRQNAAERKQQMQEELVRQAQRLYKSHFENAHQDIILPLSWEEITAIRRERGDEPVTQADMGYDAETGLCLKACMSKSCEFYLQPMKQLSSHLETMRKEDYYIDAFHRTIRLMRHSSLKEIEDAVVVGDFLQRDPKATYEKCFEINGDVLRKEIKCVREKYIEMFG